MSEYLYDPEQEPEEWQEPIYAETPSQARRDCARRAADYTEQNQAPVELVKTSKASNQSQKRYLCHFRGFKP
ncbi:MAG: hypothetical protein HC857_01145 [Synechococcales cyanobacterium RU_4_20]|nr:hypothetical protein [Synechococcales cyanobacterium RU_4_20]NJR71136.1 hypothetical protein [Synechococcales cyanobacterium CRU_2_2]